MTQVFHKEYFEEANIVERPVCPDHPGAQVIKASISGMMKSVWVCIICGKRLGDAGPREEPIRDSFTVGEE